MWSFALDWHHPLVKATKSTWNSLPDRVGRVLYSIPLWAYEGMRDVVGPIEKTAFDDLELSSTQVSEVSTYLNIS